MPFDFRSRRTAEPGFALAASSASSRITCRSSVISWASSCRMPLPWSEIVERTLKGGLPSESKSNSRLLSAAPAAAANGRLWQPPHDWAEIAASAPWPGGDTEKRGSGVPSGRRRTPTPWRPVNALWKSLSPASKTCWKPSAPEATSSDSRCPSSGKAGPSDRSIVGGAALASSAAGAASPLRRLIPTATTAIANGTATCATDRLRVMPASFPGWGYEPLSYRGVEQLAESSGEARPGALVLVLEEDVRLVPGLGAHARRPLGQLLVVVQPVPAQAQIAPEGRARDLPRRLLVGVGHAPGAAAGAQRRERVVVPPRRVAELEGDPRLRPLLGEHVEEAFEAGDVQFEVGRQLEEHRAQSFAQRLGGAQEVAGLLGGIAEALLMRDPLRRLEREAE